MSHIGTKKRSIPDRLVLFLNFLALIGLSLSYLTGIISPEKFWPLAFIGLAYPIILIAIFLFAIYWMLRRKWFLFLNIAFLMLKPDYVAATFKFNSDNPSLTEDIKIMSYNVRMFDRYNWSNDKNTRYKMRDFISNQQPDILCIQEFYRQKGDKYHTLDTLLRDGKQIHSDRYPSTLKSKDFWGIATLTSYRILDKGKITFQNSKNALVIFSDILMGADTVRIYNVHLQSIQLGKEGYAIIDELLKTQELEDVNGGKMVLSRMKNGFIKRAKQAQIIAKHIKKCPHPIILCGDFNDVPTSYAYQIIAQGLKDSFSQSGSGLGATYVRMPLFRIDNILYSGEFKANNHSVHPYKLSDHLAVTADISFR